MKKVFLCVLCASVAISCRRKPENIKLSGNLELTQVDIAFKVPGKLIERAVDEGDPVKKGQLVARLDPETARRQLTRDDAGRMAAEAVVAQMVTAVAWQRETVAGDLALRRAELAQAEARLKELQTGSRRQEIEAAGAAVEEAASEEQRASRDWQRGQALYKTGDISTQQYDQFQARYKAAAATLKKAKENQGMVNEGPRKEEIEMARAQVDRARAALRMSEANRMEIHRREEEVAARQAELARARAQASVSEAQLNDTQAFSTIDGFVLTKAAEVGQVVAAGTTVLTVGDLDHPWVRGYIREQDLGRVKQGAKVKITTDSYPGKVYWGRVTFIASDAEFTPKQIQTSEERVKMVYRVKIEVPNPQHELKANMPVDAEIVIE